MSGVACLCFTAKIQNDLRILTERLARINDNLARKIASRNEYDKTIQETEAAYAKASPCPPLVCGHARLIAALKHHRAMGLQPRAIPPRAIPFRAIPHRTATPHSAVSLRTVTHRAIPHRAITVHPVESRAAPFSIMQSASDLTPPFPPYPVRMIIMGA